MVTMSLPLDEKSLERLRERAARLGKRVEDLIAELVSSSVDEEERYGAAVREGLADADAGRLVEGDRAFAELRAKLGKLKSP